MVRSDVNTRETTFFHMTETKLLYFLWYSQTYGADSNGSWRRDIGGTEPKQQTKIEGFFCGRSSPSQVFFVCPWRHFTRIHHQQRLFPYSVFIRSTTRFAGACNPFFTSTRHFSPSFLRIHFVANLLVPETKAFYNSLSIPHSLFVFFFSVLRVSIACFPAKQSTIYKTKLCVTAELLSWFLLWFPLPVVVILILFSFWRQYYYYHHSSSSSSWAIPTTRTKKEGESRFLLSPYS